MGTAIIRYTPAKNDTHVYDSLAKEQKACKELLEELRLRLSKYARHLAKYKGKKFSPKKLLMTAKWMLLELPEVMDTVKGVRIHIEMIKFYSLLLKGLVSCPKSPG